LKAVREAKLRSDWTEQDTAYEEAVTTYAAALVSPDNDVFLEDFDRGQTEELRERFTDYALKAVREAKLRSDWTEQDTAYEVAVTTYAAAL
ncbi:hypothetical protein ACCT20_37300, partial [Rhizobium ruizarguesonis]